jgi:hypothetical protein
VPPGRWWCVRLAGWERRLVVRPPGRVGAPIGGAPAWADGSAAGQVGGRACRLAWPSWQAGVPRQVGGRACRLAVRPSWRAGVPPGLAVLAGGRAAAGGRPGVPPGCAAVFAGGRSAWPVSLRAGVPPGRWAGGRLVWCVRLGGWERRLVVHPPGLAGLSAGCASACADGSALLAGGRAACQDGRQVRCGGGYVMRNLSGRCDVTFLLGVILPNHSL